MSTLCNGTCRGNVPRGVRGPCSKTSCPILLNVFTKICFPPKAQEADCEQARRCLRKDSACRRAGCVARPSAKVPCYVLVLCVVLCLVREYLTFCFSTVHIVRLTLFVWKPVARFTLVHNILRFRDEIRAAHLSGSCERSSGHEVIRCTLCFTF